MARNCADERPDAVEFRRGGGEEASSEGEHEIRRVRDVGLKGWVVRLLSRLVGDATRAAMELRNGEGGTAGQISTADASVVVGSCWVRHA